MFRRKALAGVLALGVLAALGAAVLTASAHEDHDCLVSKDCLACRWTTAGVAVCGEPPALPAPVVPCGTLPPPALTAAADAPRSPAVSRGPPPVSSLA